MTRIVPVGNILSELAYIHIDEASNSGFIIDPGGGCSRIEDLILSHNWHIEAILLTHGHFDHIGAVKELSERFHIPYYIHRNGAQYLLNAHYNLSVYDNEEIVLEHAIYLDDGDIIRLAANPSFALHLIHTPGHTTDSSIYYNPVEHCAFVGDTIFKDGIGATHFPGGDTATLYGSIQEKILTLPPNTILYSGHSEPFTVADKI